MASYTISRAHVARQQPSTVQAECNAQHGNHGTLAPEWRFASGAL
jgi:hypothetical protein